MTYEQQPTRRSVLVSAAGVTLAPCAAMASSEPGGETERLAAVLRGLYADDPLLGPAFAAGIRALST